MEELEKAQNQAEQETGLVKQHSFLQWLRMQRGFVCYRTGRWEQAEEAFRASIDLHSATRDKRLLLENSFFLIKIKIKSERFVQPKVDSGMVSLLSHCLCLATELQETKKFNYLQSLVGIHKGSASYAQHLSLDSLDIF